MKKLNPVEYLTGFLVGALFGVFVEVIFIVLYNLLCALIGWTILHITLWMIVPAPLIFGLIMGKAIAGLHLKITESKLLLMKGNEFT